MILNSAANSVVCSCFGFFWFFVLQFLNFIYKIAHNDLKGLDLFVFFFKFRLLRLIKGTHRIITTSEIKARLQFNRRPQIFTLILLRVLRVFLITLLFSELFEKFHLPAPLPVFLLLNRPNCPQRFVLK